MDCVNLAHAGGEVGHLETFFIEDIGIAAASGRRGLDFHAEIACGPANKLNDARAFGDIRLTPTTFLIDRQGNIIKRYLGAPDFDALHAEIEALLKVRT